MKTPLAIFAAAFFIALLGIGQSQTVFAVTQSPLIEWTKTYGCLRGISVIQTSDGGYLIEGSNATYSSAHGGGYSNYAAVLVKIDAAGNQQWLKTYHTFCDSNTRVYAVQTVDGGYILAGTALGEVYSQFCLMKIDSAGNITWTKIYKTQHKDCVNSMVKLSDGGFVLVGTAISPVYHSISSLLIKTDSLGNLLWNKTYGAINDVIWTATETLDGGLAISGTSSDPSGFWLLKTDSQGTLQWQQFYKPQNITIYLKTYYPGSYARSAIRTMDGGYMLVGSSEVWNGQNGLVDAGWVIKTDSLGNALWNKTYLLDSAVTFYRVVQASDVGYLFSGDCYQTCLVRTDSAGNVEWNLTFPESKLDPLGDSIIQSSNGGFVVTGESPVGIWVAKVTEPSLPSFPSPTASAGPTASPTQDVTTTPTPTTVIPTQTPPATATPTQIATTQTPADTSTPTANPTESPSSSVPELTPWVLLLLAGMAVVTAVLSVSMKGLRKR